MSIEVIAVALIAFGAGWFAKRSQISNKIKKLKAENSELIKKVNQFALRLQRQNDLSRSHSETGSGLANGARMPSNPIKSHSPPTYSGGRRPSKYGAGYRNNNEDFDLSDMAVAAGVGVGVGLVASALLNDDEIQEQDEVDFSAENESCILSTGEEPEAIYEENMYQETVYEEPAYESESFYESEPMDFESSEEE